MFLLLAIFILAVMPPHPARAEPRAVSVFDVDSLRCPVRDSLLAYVKNRLEFDVRLREQRIHRLLVEYARLEALRQELAILERQKANLQLVYALYLKKQERSEASDLAVLESEQNFLNKELTIISTRYQIKETILSILDLSIISVALPK